MNAWIRFSTIILTYCLFILITGFIGIFSMEQSFASPVEIIVNENYSNDNFSVKPEGAKIFDVKNMKPGDNESTSVNIINHGGPPFDLTLALDVVVHEDGVKGHEKLLKSLELTLTDPENDGKVHYSGLLSEMGTVNLGEIPSGQGKELDFMLAFKTGQGNVTQKRKADLTWTFAGKGDTGTGEGTTGITGSAGPLGAPGPDSPPGPAQDLATPPSPEEPAPVLLTEPGDAPLEPEAEPEETVAPVEEIAVAPEEPAAVPKKAEITAFNYWPLLLLLLLPLLLWLLYATSLLVLVPGKDGDYEIVARKFARRKDKRWHVNVEKQLNKYVDKYGFVAVDFRGRFLKDANKAVYAGKTSIGSGNKRFALVSSHRLTTWLEDLYKKGNRAVG